MADAGGGKPQVILIATGSEVYLCIDAYEKLKAEAYGARRQHAVVGFVRASGPELRDEVLPPDVTERVAVEMGSTFGWAQYAGPKGRIIACAALERLPRSRIAKEIRLHHRRVVQAARELLGK